MHSYDLILTLTGGLSAALVFGYITQRIGLSPIVGYLLKVTLLGVFTATAGTRVIPLVLDWVARTRSRELFTLTVLVVALGIAVGSSLIPTMADGVDAARLAGEMAPDVILLDVSMPRMGGLEALAADGMRGARVILLTAAIEPQELLRAVQLGARGVILKETATQHLIDGIHRVVDGRFVIGTEAADGLAQAVQRAGGHKGKPYGLTPREIDIVEAIAAGDSNRDIAARLAISLQTVKHHLTSIFDKTGTSTRLDLALLAIRQGLVRTR